jgi:hypothetical protein
MNDNTTFALALYLVSAMLYAFIGMRLSQKTFPDTDSARAWNGFRIWWYGMAVNSAINFLSVLLFAMGITDLTVHLILKVANIIVPSLALWGLLSYLLYVFTGSQRSNLVLTIFYVLFAVALMYGTFALQPTGVRMDEWNTGLVNAVDVATLGPGAGLVIFLSFILAIALPPFLAAIALFTLFFRLKERSQKYRSVMVPAGIMILFGISTILPLLLWPFGIQVGQLSWWPVTIRILGVLGLVVIYWGYYPPTFIQRSLQVAPLT